MNTQEWKDKLLQLRAETEAALKTAGDSVRPVELDQTSVGRVSRIDAIQQQEMALAAERRRNELMVRIDAALGRIDSGDYGYCTNCGEDIAAARLATDPTLLLCITCAARS
ncbi:MAG: TraR/DksA family transcriptional regulator [Alphaproteobacteria bacterium]|nr:TraR/DksA family transcriptional regulator [Alphaproteobacteria bacterium]